MVASAETLLARPFAPIGALVAAHARERPDRPALIHDARRVDYRGLDAAMDRVAAALHRDGVVPRQVIAICAATSIDYATVFLGALRAGVAVAPLATSATAETLAAMVDDCGARLVFVDRAIDAQLGARGPRRVVFDAAAPARAGDTTFVRWLEGAGGAPDVAIDPSWPFNLIYSSGTTGTPKGIVQPHSMRWQHILRGGAYGYDTSAVTLLATPLYSNTTLVSFIPTIARGGCAVLMGKFDARGYLELAQRHRATHTMLVPVQYQRIMALPDFGAFDLSSFRMKQCTSAPFPAALKADVVARWPGALVEIYGMTEGGGTCMLAAHQFPDKLHTVGRPAPGHDIRIIDDQGRELPRGATGEVVGRSASMMIGYHARPDLTREAEWFDADGNRYIRTGDIGRFDDDGFLVLLDRRKDMIISGGFNVYPSDLEAVLRGRDDVADVAVVGVPSAQWGETPVAFVVPRAGARIDPEELRAWANERLGRVQRIAALECIDELPRSAIGKVLKRELRDRWVARQA